MTTKTDVQKKPGQPKMIDEHMLEIDMKWRKAEGRKPFDLLTDREKMLEGATPWNPELLKHSTLI
ncbi:hypothetical protein D3C78_1941170 [compost metagenome]